MESYEYEDQMPESPPSSGAFGDVMRLRITTSSPNKRSRRSLKKRVVSIPIKDLEGGSSKIKGDGGGAPPPDSWAWRKYGQKPIKGSPYPRGYYRCSSSKGCPARKQVERSRDDPTMLVITYSSEHNHPWPSTAARNNHQHHRHNTTLEKASSSAAAAATVESPEDHEETKPNVSVDPEPETEPKPQPEPEEEKFTEPPLLLPSSVDEFGWFAVDMQTTTSSVLQLDSSPYFFAESGCHKTRAADADVAMFFPIAEEEDESLFADLGELPECAMVFRQRDVGTQVQIF